MGSIGKVVPGSAASKTSDAGHPKVGMKLSFPLKGSDS